MEEYIKSQDRDRQRVILSHILRMENAPFRNTKKLEPPLDRLYRARIGNDRLLFSIRENGVIYLEYMDDRRNIYKRAKRFEAARDSI